jgi:hypothetical protein
VLEGVQRFLEEEGVEDVHDVVGVAQVAKGGVAQATSVEG